MSRCFKDLVKKCSKCEIISLKTNFNKDRTKKDGYRPSCKSCCNKYYSIVHKRILNSHKICKKNNRSKKMLTKDKRENLISILN